MSTNAIVLQTPNQAIINTDLSKIFLWNNRSQSGTFEYVNTEADVTIVAGTVLGRIAATQKLAIIATGASDGSQFPVGVLMQDVEVAYLETFSGAVDFCVAGDVAQEQLAFPTGVTLATVVSGKTLFDRLGSDTVGIQLVATTENTALDNQ